MATRRTRQHLTQIYSDVLLRSPKWIKVAFRIFLTLPDRIVLQNPFLYFVLGQGTSAYKLDKMTSDYGVPKVEEENCSNCIFAYQNVVNKKYFCSHVRGDIELEKWCALHKGERNEDKSGMISPEATKSLKAMGATPINEGVVYPEEQTGWEKASGDYGDGKVNSADINPFIDPFSPPKSIHHPKNNRRKKARHQKAAPNTFSHTNGSEKDWGYSGEPPAPHEFIMDKD